MWFEAPESAADMFARIGAARASHTDVAMACWAVLVLLPRGVLHLASWVLTHPLRLILVAFLVAVYAAVN